MNFINKMANKFSNNGGDSSYRELAAKLLPLLGGPENITNLDFCSTRIRFKAVNPDQIVDEEIKKIVPGIVKSGSFIQVIIGPEVEKVVMELRKIMVDYRGEIDLNENLSENFQSHIALARRILVLLGGPENIEDIDNCTTRVRLKVINPEKVKDVEIKKLVPGVIKKDNLVHIIIGPEVEFITGELKKFIAEFKMGVSRPVTFIENEFKSFRILAEDVIPLLGGAKNIKDIDHCITRLRIEVVDPLEVDVARIKKLIPEVTIDGYFVQGLIGDKIDQIAGEFKSLVEEYRNNADKEKHKNIKSSKDIAEFLLKLLGGKENVKVVDNCSTRLRVEVRNSEKVNYGEIKEFAAGLIKKDTSVQVILGPYAPIIADELKKLLNNN